MLFLGRLFDRIDVIKPVSNVRPSICTYLRAYVHLSTKCFFDFSEIRHVRRGRCVMHDGIQYDPIQGKGQGHEPFKVGNLAIFNHLQWELATDHGLLN